MDKCIDSINNSFADLLKRFNKVALLNHSNESINEGAQILQDGISVLKILKTNIKSLETMLSDCQDFMKDAIDDLSQKPKEEEFVYHTKNGMLSYPGRELVIQDLHRELLKPYKKEEVSSQTGSQSSNTSSQGIGQSSSGQPDGKSDSIPVSASKKNGLPNKSVLIKELNYKMNLPYVSKIEDIPPAFYYFAGDAKYTEGIYCNIAHNIYTRIPFPEISDSTKEYGKNKSIRCKHITVKQCDDQRNNMAKYHNSPIRTCNFAHTGEKITKIGYPSRCAKMPNFGNPLTLHSDMSNIDKDSIKNILLYGLNDVMLASITIDHMKYNKNVVIFDKLQYA